MASSRLGRGGVPGCRPRVRPGGGQQRHTRDLKAYSLIALAVSLSSASASAGGSPVGRYGRSGPSRVRHGRSPRPTCRVVSVRPDRYDELRTLADTIDGDARPARRCVHRATKPHRRRFARAAQPGRRDSGERRTQSWRAPTRHRRRVASRRSGESRLRADVPAGRRPPRDRSPALRGRSSKAVDLAALAASSAEGFRVMAQSRGCGSSCGSPLDPSCSPTLSRSAGPWTTRCPTGPAAPAGSELTVAVGSRRGWAWVAVRDEGPTVSASDQERIFDRFVLGSPPRAATASRAVMTPSNLIAPRNEATLSLRNVGSGLGLAIARQIVEAHEGRLLLDSEPGRGSTFVIWLPDRAIDGVGERPLRPEVRTRWGVDDSDHDRRRKAQGPSSGLRINERASPRRAPSFSGVRIA